MSTNTDNNKFSNALKKISKMPALTAGILEDAAAILTKEGCYVLNTHRVGIWTTKNEEKILKSIAFFDMKKGEYDIQNDFTLTNRQEYIKLLRSERLLVINDIKEPNVLSDLVDEYGPDICALLDAPIRIDGNLVGVVCIEQDRCREYPERRVWTADEQSFVSSLADFMTLALARNERLNLMKRNETLMNNLPGMAYQCVNDPPDFTFTYVSNGCLNLTGYTPEEFTGNSALKFFDMVHPLDSEMLAKQNEVTLSVGMPLDTTFRIITKDGSIKWIWERSSVVEFTPDGSAYMLEGFYLDVTERQRAETAEAASKLKSDFLAAMSHEIRTPLNAIIGIAQIELEKNNLPDEKASAFEKIHASGNHLLGIINDILDMSKIETGKLKLNLVEYDVPSLINDTVQLNIVRIGSKQINFIMDINEDLPSVLYGDELRIKQILNNLLSNAIKYTENGYVKLSVSHKKEGEAAILNFIVEDTGQGMKPKDQEQLFTEFVRFNEDVNRSTEGTGLGLSITKRLVKMMDGTITVKSEYKKGSTFTVTVRQKIIDCLPIGASVADRLNNFMYVGDRQAEKLKLTREIMPYGNVLIVDDVDTNLYVAEGLLKPYKLKIETAGSGFEAMDKVNGGAVYDVIFMDHMMPQMDGIETTKMLRAEGYTGVIVALTANALAGNSRMFAEKGFNDFISKPIDIKVLNTVLNKFVRDMHPEEAKKYQPETTVYNESTPATADLKLIKAFLQDAAKSVAVLRKTDGGYDIKLLTTTAHAMKSALLNIGEDEASSLASKLESAGLSGNTEFISANLEKFIAILENLLKIHTADENNSINQEDITEDRVYLSEQLKIAQNACKHYEISTAYEAVNRLKEKPWKAETLAAIEKICDTLYLESDFEKAEQLIVSLLD